jgi:hypothetical protein
MISGCNLVSNVAKVLIETILWIRNVLHINNANNNLLLTRLKTYYMRSLLWLGKNKYYV